MSSSGHTEGVEGVVMVERTDAPELQNEEDRKTIVVEPAAAASAATSTFEQKQPPEKHHQPETTTTTRTSTSATKINDNNDTMEYAVNIVSIGTKEENYPFRFHKDRLKAILSKVPPGMLVATVSVVGAFRTGKSFLLSWFLHYLKQHSAAAAGGANAGTVTDDDDGNNKKWYETISRLDRDEAFHWQAGSERDTTGIWMWSEPIVYNKADGSQVAILLIDTQGMFDNETSMDLTAAIFGFSTLLSSYQIYNVDKRIQEDHLQQLALFSEYANTAIKEVVTEKPVDKKHPFQRLEFLVRDWQNFNDDEKHLDKMEEQMNEYLTKVLAERDIPELTETRKQIVGTFKNITCFGFCHPGFAVTKEKFAGKVSEMEPLFLKLLDRFCQRVFSQVDAKVIHGRALTAMEFGNYFAAYAQLFVDGSKFPKAVPLLEAAANANNTSALELALEEYHSAMERIAGPKCSSYVNPIKLKKEHAEISRRSLEIFKSAANFGNSARIVQTREKLEKRMSEKYEFYHSLNAGRNPLPGFEKYVISVLVAVVSMVLRWVTDLTCSASVCRATSDALLLAFAFVMIFLLIAAVTKVQQVQAAFMRMKQKPAMLFASHAWLQQQMQKSKMD